ncbi:CAP domain-containing protein [Cupriavidus basilensis]
MRKTIFAFSIVAALSGCGGGGDSTSGGQPATGAPSTPTTPIPPVVTTDSTLVTVAPAGTYSDADKLAAYNYLNTQRLACGFGALAQNTALDKSAQAHANFVAANIDAGRSDAYGHFENPAYPGYTGHTPLDRANLQSYGGVGVSEDLAADQSANTAVQAFLSATYHAISALGGDHDIGIGVSPTMTTRAGRIVVLNPGLRSLSELQYLDSKTVATFPCDGQADVVRQHAFEAPSPIPGRDFSTNAPGRAIFAIVRLNQTLNVSEFSVTPAGGNALKATLLTSNTDPNKALSSNVAVLIPDSPLAAKTTFTAKLVGTNNGQPVNKTWSFTTQ